MGEHPGVIENACAVATAKYDHFINSRIIYCAMIAAYIWRPAGWGKLCPGRRAAQTIRIGKHPGVVEEIATTVAASKDDHAVVRHIIDCAVTDTSRWSTSSAELCPGGSTAQAVRISKDPGVVIPTTTAVVTTEDDQFV